MLTPTSIRKLLYNPAPLNKLIGKACLAAWNRKQGPRTGSRDPRPWGTTGTYADENLLRGVELNSGRDVLLTLDEILNSRKSAGNQAR